MSDDYVTHEQMKIYNQANVQIVDRMESVVERLEDSVNSMQEKNSDIAVAAARAELEAKAASQAARTATDEVKKIQSQILPLPRFVKYMMVVAAAIALFVTPFVPHIMKKIYPPEVPNAEAKK